MNLACIFTLLKVLSQTVTSGISFERLVRTRWERFSDMPLNPLTGETFAGIDFVNVACVMGWRVTYKGSRTIAPAVMGPADMTWQ